MSLRYLNDSGNSFSSHAGKVKILISHCEKLGQYCQTHPTIVKKLCESFYVDNLVTRAGDEDQAYQLFVQLKMLKEGGFNLRKFFSNSLLLQVRVDGDQGNQPSQSTS